MTSRTMDQGRWLLGNPEGRAKTRQCLPEDFLLGVRCFIPRKIVHGKIGTETTAELLRRS